MSESDGDKITTAATAVMQALQPLDPEGRTRVVEAAAALYGISVGHGDRAAANRGGSAGDEELESEQPERERSEAGKRQSIVEFLRDRQPATNVQRIAAFAYYREHVEKKGSMFARRDLEGYFTSAKLGKPGNYDRDFNGAVREGWIHEDGAESYLTQEGENTVRAGFGGKGKARGAATAKKKRSSAPKTP